MVIGVMVVVGWFISNRFFFFKYVQLVFVLFVRCGANRIFEVMQMISRTMCPGNNYWVVAARIEGSARVFLSIILSMKKKKM